MKQVALENIGGQSIAIESLISSESCSNENIPCNVNNIWLNDVIKKNKTLFFKPKIWKSLSTYIKKKKTLSYHEAMRFIICIGIQLTAFTEINYGFTHFNLDDITVIDEDWYLITNFTNMNELNDDSKITITTPFTYQPFSSPELRNISSLPTEIDQSCSYYSVAMICLHVLGLKYNDEDMKKLYPSPLFFFLKRCLDNTPEERAYLLI